MTVKDCKLNKLVTFVMKMENMNAIQPMVSLKGTVPRLAELQLAEPVDWEIKAGQQWAILGPNGSGKTLLADLLQRKYALKEGEIFYHDEAKGKEWVRSIAFKDIYSLADYRNSYYQQRWHSTETEEMPLVKELLQEYLETDLLWELLALFDVEELLPKRIIFLSSGELRKFLIIRALLRQPRILILDNPFIGLDAASRELLVEMLNQMATLRDVQVVLLLSDPRGIPSMITHVLPVYNKRLFSPVTRKEFLKDHKLQQTLFPDEVSPVVLPAIDAEKSSHTVTFRMDRVTIKYGDRIILKELDWEVRNGEKWALSGVNGSGKSTLLSLVYADNPQAYANRIHLFDNLRGSGESIWDIKRRIGYVSPEMHMYYMENVPAIRIVGSGFFDSIGLYRSCNEEQQKRAEEWMAVFGIAHLKDRLFLSLSSGEQRLVLLARAFVKNPDLLVLDEPLHGLDIHNKKKVARIIETFCDQPGKTLVYVTHYPHELPACVDKRFELIKHP